MTADDPSDTEVTGKSDGDNDANADSGKDADNDPTNDPVVVTLDQTASLSVTKSTTVQIKQLLVVQPALMLVTR